MFNIFEQPWTVLIIAVIALIVMLLAAKKSWWQLVVPLLFVAAAFGLDFLVQTDREKIEAVIRTAVKAVEQEDCSAIEAIISADYRDSYHASKAALMYHCRSRLAEPVVEKNIKRTISVEISPPTATVIFTVRTLFDKNSYIYQEFKREMFTKLRLEFQKQAQDWLICRAEILALDRQPAGWRDIR
jgi:hypothetical protein